ncbi:MAG: hypothetical protein M3275_06615 [Thermoproteota archaeon]|nr:hypothetical protein [Thermoproteota archaeon]
MSEGKQLEIEVRDWDGNSFTIEAGIDPQFEQQLTQGVVPLLILRHNGRQVQQLRNVRVRSISTHFQESRVENFLEDSTRQVTVFKYEEGR